MILKFMYLFYGIPLRLAIPLLSWNSGFWLSMYTSLFFVYTRLILFTFHLFKQLQLYVLVSEHYKNNKPRNHKEENYSHLISMYIYSRIIISFPYSILLWYALWSRKNFNAFRELFYFFVCLFWWISIRLFTRTLKYDFSFHAINLHYRMGEWFF